MTATLLDTANATEVAAFLGYVHEHAIDAGLPGRVVVSEKQPPDSKVKYLSRSFRLDQLDEAAAGCVRISTRDRNAYVRVHLISRDLDRPTERGAGVDTRFVAHFAADVDFGTAGHTSDNLPPDEHTAQELIDATLPPSAVISSGGGRYPIWRLAEPFEVVTDDDRAAVKSIGRRLDRALAGHGWHVDPTVVDLARVIRPPGVMNHKAGRDPRRVKVARGYECGAGDFTLDDLDRALPALPERPLVAPVAAPSGRVASSTASAPWEVLVEMYTDDQILAADPHDRWERVDDQPDGAGRLVPAWRRVGSSADYSIKAGSGGAFIVWSSTLAARLGIDPGGGISRWQLLCAFAGRDPREAARWKS